MNTRPQLMASIRERLASAPRGPERFLWGATASVGLGMLIDGHGTSLGGRRAELAGRSVLVATRDPLAAALALIELDGFVRRLIVCTPDLSSEHLRALVSNGGVDAIVSDYDRRDDGMCVPLQVLCESRVTPAPQSGISPSELTLQTEWVLPPSGTAGAPKRVVPRFTSLTAPIGTPPGRDADVVWGTFYDIRRYGG